MKANISHAPNIYEISAKLFVIFIKFCYETCMSREFEPAIIRHTAVAVIERNDQVVSTNLTGIMRRLAFYPEEKRIAILGDFTEAVLDEMPDGTATHTKFLFAHNVASMTPENSTCRRSAYSRAVDFVEMMTAERDSVHLGLITADRLAPPALPEYLAVKLAGQKDLGYALQLRIADAWSHAIKALMNVDRAHAVRCATNASVNPAIKDAPLARRAQILCEHLETA